MYVRACVCVCMCVWRVSLDRARAGVVCVYVCVGAYHPLLCITRISVCARPNERARVTKLRYISILVTIYVTISDTDSANGILFSIDASLA